MTGVLKPVHQPPSFPHAVTEVFPSTTSHESGENSIDTQDGENRIVAIST